MAARIDGIGRGQTGTYEIEMPPIPKEAIANVLARYIQLNPEINGKWTIDDLESNVTWHETASAEHNARGVDIELPIVTEYNIYDKIHDDPHLQHDEYDNPVDNLSESFRSRPHDTVPMSTPEAEIWAIPTGNNEHPRHGSETATGATQSTAGETLTNEGGQGDDPREPNDHNNNESDNGDDEEEEEDEEEDETDDEEDDEDDYDDHDQPPDDRPDRGNGPDQGGENRPAAHATESQDEAESLEESMPTLIESPRRQEETGNTNEDPSSSSRLSNILRDRAATVDRQLRANPSSYARLMVMNQELLKCRPGDSTAYKPQGHYEEACRRHQATNSATCELWMTTKKWIDTNDGRTRSQLASFSFVSVGHMENVFIAYRKTQAIPTSTGEYLDQRETQTLIHCNDTQLEWCQKFYEEARKALEKRPRSTERAPIFITIPEYVPWPAGVTPVTTRSNPSGSATVDTQTNAQPSPQNLGADDAARTMRDWILQAMGQHHDLACHAGWVGQPWPPRKYRRSCFRHDALNHKCKVLWTLKLSEMNNTSADDVFKSVGHMENVFRNYRRWQVTSARDINRPSQLAYIGCTRTQADWCHFYYEQAMRATEVMPFSKVLDPVFIPLPEETMELPVFPYPDHDGTPDNDSDNDSGPPYGEDRSERHWLRQEETDHREMEQQREATGSQDTRPQNIPQEVDAAMASRPGRELAARAAFLAQQQELRNINRYRARLVMRGNADIPTADHANFYPLATAIGEELAERNRGDSSAGAETSRITQAGQAWLERMLEAPDAEMQRICSLQEPQQRMMRFWDEEDPQTIEEEWRRRRNTYGPSRIRNCLHTPGHVVVAQYRPFPTFDEPVEGNQYRYCPPGFVAPHVLEDNLNDIETHADSDTSYMVNDSDSDDTQERNRQRHDWRDPVITQVQIGPYNTTKSTFSQDRAQRIRPSVIRGVRKINDPLGGRMVIPRVIDLTTPQLEGDWFQQVATMMMKMVPEGEETPLRLKIKGITHHRNTKKMWILTRHPYTDGLHNYYCQYIDHNMVEAYFFDDKLNRKDDDHDPMEFHHHLVVALIDGGKWSEMLRASWDGSYWKPQDWTTKTVWVGRPGEAVESFWEPPIQDFSVYEHFDRRDDPSVCYRLTQEQRQARCQDWKAFREEDWMNYACNNIAQELHHAVRDNLHYWDNYHKVYRIRPLVVSQSNKFLPKHGIRTDMDVDQIQMVKAYLLSSLNYWDLKVSQTKTKPREIISNLYFLLRLAAKEWIYRTSHYNYEGTHNNQIPDDWGLNRISYFVVANAVRVCEHRQWDLRYWKTVQDVREYELGGKFPYSANNQYLLIPNGDPPSQISTNCRHHPSQKQHILSQQELAACQCDRCTGAGIVNKKDVLTFRSWHQAQWRLRCEGYNDREWFYNPVAIGLEHHPQWCTGICTRCDAIHGDFKDCKLKRGHPGPCKCMICYRDTIWWDEDIENTMRACHMEPHVHQHSGEPMTAPGIQCIAGLPQRKRNRSLPIHNPNALRDTNNWIPQPLTDEDLINVTHLDSTLYWIYRRRHDLDFLREHLSTEDW